MINRRNLLKSAPVLAVAAPLAACNGTGIDPTTLVNIINGVQQGIAKACAGAGAVVPTAASILNMVNAIIGAAGGTQITEAVVIADLIASITAKACPAPVVGNFKLGDPLNPSSVTVTVNKVDVAVHFISFAKS